LKAVILNVLTSFVTLLLLLLVGEGVLRGYYFFKQRTMPGFVKSFELDDTLGWCSMPDLDVTTTALDAAGRPYPLRVTTNAWGFRLFGDTTRRDRPRLLVIGDSFTQAVEVSDDKTYFSYLRDSLGAEVFAYGCGGFGTLQEYLVLDRYLDRIQPDAVLLQHCSNDFINNDYALERASLGNNNAMRRPYLLPDGRIELRFPKNGLTGLRHFANAHSRLLYFVFSRLDRAAARYGTKNVEKEIEAGGPDQPRLRESIRVTDALLKKFKARLPAGVPLVLVPVTGTQPYYDAYLGLARRNHLPVVPGIDSTVRAAEAQGVTARAADGGHWNNEGHRLAAGVMLAYFRQHPLFARPQPLLAAH
jgi:hypothetical protein